MNVRFNRFYAWDGNIRRQLRRLTYREGQMWDYANSGPRNAPTWVMFIKGKAVGWCVAAEDLEPECVSIMLYVQRDYRERGIGTKLFKRAEAWTKRHSEIYRKYKAIEVFPADQRSFAFFDSVGYEAPGFWYGKWYDNPPRLGPDYD